MLLGVGTIRLTSKATPLQVPLATLQVKPVGLHFKTLVSPAALQCTNDPAHCSHPSLGHQLAPSPKIMIIQFH